MTQQEIIKALRNGLTGVEFYPTYVLNLSTVKFVK